jgi:23S rRNA pseudouridine2605 synthase
MTSKRRPNEDDAPDSDILPGAGAPPEDAPDSAGEAGGSPFVRLNKFLASQGVASRRKCDELILAGRVFVDGKVVRELGVRVDPATQEVEVDGQVFKARGARLRYYLLNKPKGVVCTNEERETRPRAVDLITDPRKGRIFTVGRLDEESEGLILITNDGEFAQRVMHPRYGVEKTYEVEVFGHIEDDALGKVRTGVHLAEGRTAGARVLIKSRRNDASRLTVSIREGMNREIRRAFARVGHKVLHLRRVRIGPITDRGLKPGRWRELATGEVRALLEGGEHYERPRRRPTDKAPRKTRAHSGKPGIARRHAQVAERLREREQRGFQGGPPRKSGPRPTRRGA